MKLKLIKIVIFVFLCIIGSTAPLVSIPTNALKAADICDMGGNATKEAREAAGCDKNNKNSLPKVVTDILKVIIGSLAIVSAIFIVVGGVNYMTSGGDTNKVKKAKDTILYSTIGLVICALAFAIVNWVLASVLGQ